MRLRALRVAVAGVLGCLLWLGAAAAQTVVLDGATQRTDVAGKLQMFRDDGASLGVQDIIAADQAGKFRSLRGDLTAGYTDAAIWVKLTLARSPGASVDWLLDVGFPFLDHVDLYKPDGQGGMDAVKTGAALPFATREVPYHDFVFKLALPSEEPEVFYLRFRSHSSIAARISVASPESFWDDVRDYTFLLGTLHGALIIITIFSLAQYMFTRDSLYLHYCVYNFCWEVLYVAYNGFISEYIFPSAPWISYNILQIMLCCTFGVAALYLARLLDMRQRLPWLNRLFQLGPLAGLAGVVAIFKGHYGEFIPILYVLMAIGMFIAMVICIQRARRGDRVAVSYAISFSVFFLALAAVNMRALGLIDAPLVADWALQVANTLHMVTLSVGMAQRITVIEREKNEAQQALLAVAQRHERDLEERVASRTAALSESEDRFRTLSEATTEAIVLHADGIVLDGNPRMASMFGFADDRAMAGIAMDSLFAADCRAAALAAATQGDLAPQAFTGLRRDGTGFPLELHSRAATKEGRPILVTTIRDLTQHHLMEARLLNTAAEAQAASRAKSDFLAMMSYEIRTPLHGILGLTHLLEQSGIDEGQAEYLHTIQSSGEALMNILNDVLDFSKMEAGSLRIIEAPFQLRPTLDVVVNLLRAKAEEKGLELRVKVEGRIPDLLIGDAHRLRQVLLNLLGNAIKFTNAGEVALAVRALDLEPESAELEITVSDTGIGIPEEAQASLFQAFIQAHTGTSHGGTGLGLAICRRIVEAQGGHLGVESVPGKGSRFWFRLHYRSNAEPALVPPDLPKDHLGAPIGSLIILLVEDNVVNRTIAQVILERRGHRIVTATNGHEAVAFAESEDAAQISMILMDMHMPGMDGLDATRAIRAMASPVALLPIVGLTAAAMSDEMQSCLDAGMNEVIAKPFKPVTLCAAVEKWSRREEMVKSA